MTNPTPLSPEREQEIRDSIPTVYGPPWTVHPDMDDDVWRVRYATDHPLAGLVCEVPDYGAHLAEFIATARAAVPELLAEIERLRGQRKYLLTQLAKRDAETGRGDRALTEFLTAHPGEDVETPAAVEETCGKCRQPFDPADTRFDGRARYHETPYCRGCVDRCHDNEIADHRCVICA
ncbi:hypothetical protein [Streptomyces canus]|uniref:hypothetical protein n=1 Tax=Streptomyces canus TaxID=58343 RepID=UPI0033B775C2